jgi:hypothetical protein
MLWLRKRYLHTSTFFAIFWQVCYLLLSEILLFEKSCSLLTNLYVSSVLSRRNNTHLNDTKFNNNQHNDTEKYETQLNGTLHNDSHQNDILDHNNNNNITQHCVLYTQHCDNIMIPSVRVSMVSVNGRNLAFIVSVALTSAVMMRVVAPMFLFCHKKFFCSNL